MVVRRINPDELTHHGIKGQQWGKMHGPPYPLSSQVSTGKKLKKNTEYIDKRYKKVVKNSERTSSILKAKRDYDKKQYEKTKKDYENKYDDAKSDSQRARINNDYEKKLNKSYNRYVQSDFNLQKHIEKSNALINYYKNMSPADVSEDRKRKAKIIIRDLFTVNTLPLVSTISNINKDIQNDRAAYSRYSNKRG